MNISISPYVTVFFHGLVLSLGLIIAIGAQNAFVLRQGLRREHVTSVVLFCALADAVLIAAGVFGMAKVLGENQTVAQALALIGATFLGVYGWRALRRAMQSQQLVATSGVDALGRAAVLTQAAAFTLLNPHVYLDTVLLAGSIGAQHPDPLQIWFVIGASTASALWFGLLGFGSHKLAPIFARPGAWRALEALIGVTMFFLAGTLVLHALKAA
jgi:L-lysine exporter family protein LysE/ArgO